MAGARKLRLLLEAHSLAKFSLNRTTLIGMTIIVMTVILLFPISLPINVSSYVENIYNKVGSKPAGTYAIVMLGVGPVHMFDGSSFPAIMAIIQQFFNQHYKVIFVSNTYPEGPIYARLATGGNGYGEPQTISKLIDVKGAVYGVDYVILPFIGGSETGLSLFLADTWAAAPTDYFGTQAADLPIMADLHNAANVGMYLSATISVTGLQADMRQAYGKWSLPVVIACPDASGPTARPYVLSGQAIGVIYGARYSAEYEKLSGKTGQGTATMGQFSIAVFMYVILVVGFNIFNPYKKQIGAVGSSQGLK